MSLPEANHKFVAVHIGSCHSLKSFAHLKRLEKWLETQENKDELEIISRNTYLERGDKDVIVTALFTGKPVTLKARDRGGCCYPSTERYYSM